MRCFLVYIIIIFAVSVHAEGTLEFKQKQKNLIRDLYASGQFLNASAEASRLCFYYPGEEYDEWRFFQAVALFRACDYDASLGINIKRDSIRTAFLARECYMSLGRYGEAYNVLSGFPYVGDDGSSWSLLSYRIDTLIEAGNFADAALEAGHYHELFPGSAPAYDLYRDLVNYKSLKMPSPWKAVALSAFMPGAGQVYAGRWRDGAISFFSVALGAAATALCFIYGQADLGWTFSFFTGLFYSGTMYGAYNSAREKSVSLRREYVHKIRSSYIPAYEPDRDLRRDRLFD